MKVDHIVKMATDTNNIKPDIRKNTIRVLTVHLENALKFHRRLQRHNLIPHQYLRCLNLPYSACYVTMVYLLSKCLYLINVTVQFSLLNQFLVGGYDNYTYYGWSALRDILNGTTWHTSGIFPRVTLCDFEVRSVGSIVQKYTIQCVLVINLFNEKIFVFLWFWFLILGILTLFSCFYWGILMVLPWFSRWYIARHLELSEMPFNRRDQETQRDVRKFVCDYLKTDGVFVIRMATMHTSIIFGTDLVVSLWRSFYGIEEKVKAQSSSEAESAKIAKANLSYGKPGAHGLPHKNDADKFRVLRLRGSRKNQDDSAHELSEVLVDKMERDLVDGGNVAPQPYADEGRAFPAPPESWMPSRPRDFTSLDDDEEYWIPKKKPPVFPKPFVGPTAPPSPPPPDSPNLAGFRRSEL